MEKEKTIKKGALAVGCKKLPQRMPQSCFKSDTIYQVIAIDVVNHFPAK